MDSLEENFAKTLTALGWVVTRPTGETVKAPPAPKPRDPVLLEELHAIPFYKWNSSLGPDKTLHKSQLVGLLTRLAPRLEELGYLKFESHKDNILEEFHYRLTFCDQPHSRPLD